MEICLLPVCGLMLAAVCLCAGSILSQHGIRQKYDEVYQHEWLFTSPHEIGFQPSRTHARRGVPRRWNDNITPMDSVSQVGNKSRGTRANHKHLGGEGTLLARQGSIRPMDSISQVPFQPARMSYGPDTTIPSSWS